MKLDMFLFSDCIEKCEKMDKLQLLQVAKKMLLLGGGKENKNSDNLDRKHNHHKPKTMRTVSNFPSVAKLFYN